MADDKPWLSDPVIGDAKPLPNGGVYIPPTMSPKEATADARDETRTGIAVSGDIRDQKRTAVSIDDTSFRQVKALRDEFDQDVDVKKYKTIVNQLSSMLNSPLSTAGDQSRINAFSQMLNPTSTVMLGEYQAAENNQALIDSIQARIGKELKFDDSGRLTEESRRDLDDAAINIANRSRESYNSRRGYFSELAERRSVDPFEVVGPHSGDAYREKLEAYDKRRRGSPKDSAPPPVAGVMGREVALPPGYQEAHDKFIAGIPRGKLDPDKYEEFRSGLDEQFGLPKTAPGLYRDSGWVKAYNDPKTGPSKNKIPASTKPMSDLDENVTAYFAEAANTLMAGTMDDMAPMIGLSPEQVQASKEYLRERNPFASLAGGVGGGALALATVGTVAPAALAGRGALATDIGLGAALGAGENNENRIGGALVGGAAGALGNVIGNKVAGYFGRKADDAIPQGADDALPPDVPPTAQPEFVPPVDAPPANPQESEDIAKLARKAATIGVGRSKAKRQLAEIAKVNPEAQAAAERLGVELPVDILSDDMAVRGLAGLARSQQGSSAESAWYAMVRDVSQKSEEALEALGASKDLSQVSQDVFDRIEGSMKSLQSNADGLRREVNDAIDVRAPVNASNLQKELGDVINDMGGIDDAKAAMSSEERKLLAMLGEGDVANTPTYARLNLIRDQIGEARDKGKGPWVDTAKANLKRYYGALASDQLEHVRTVGGDALAEKMSGSNALFKQMFDAREDLVATFGNDLSKSLASTLGSAVKKGAKGDISGINTILEKVPEDLRGQALLSGLLSASRKSSAEGGFSFTNYSKLYRGIRENGKVYKALAKEFGEGGEQVLADLYAISRRIDAGENRVLKTGKALQGASAILDAENLVSRIFRSTAGKAIGTGATAAGAGPLGAGVASVVQESLRGGTRGKRQAVHELLSSPDFREMAERMGANDVSDAAINKLADSQPFAKFGRTQLGLKTFKDRATWIRSSFINAPTQSGAFVQEEQ